MKKTKHYTNYYNSDMKKWAGAIAQAMNEIDVENISSDKEKKKSKKTK